MLGNLKKPIHFRVKKKLLRKLKSKKSSTRSSVKKILKKKWKKKLKKTIRKQQRKMEKKKKHDGKKRHRTVWENVAVWNLIPEGACLKRKPSLPRPRRILLGHKKSWRKPIINPKLTFSNRRMRNRRRGRGRGYRSD